MGRGRGREWESKEDRKGKMMGMERRWEKGRG